MLIQVLVQVVIQLLYFFFGNIQLLKLLRTFSLELENSPKFYLKKAFFQLLLYQNSLIQ